MVRVFKYSDPLKNGKMRVFKYSDPLKAKPLTPTTPA